MAPFKSLLQTGFMMWMSGNSINIFSIMITAMIVMNTTNVRLGNRRRHRLDAAQGHLHGWQSGGRCNGRVQMLQHGSAADHERRLDVATAHQTSDRDVVVCLKLQPVVGRSNGPTIIVRSVGRSVVRS
uniref:ER membrane protein complex subunit 4 n=1 Tax=Hyaloperonospora arabidopsidis (strain Emoy2) TaxID=559515 RepID=M4BA98_HYAAE